MAREAKKGFSVIGGSLKARLASALFLASAPGVVLASLEAQRSFTTAQQSEQSELRQEAALISARLDDAAAGGRILLSALSQLSTVRTGGSGCPEALNAALADTSRFGDVLRTNSAGRVICATRPDDARDFSKTAWFKAVRAGQSSVVSDPGVDSEQGGVVLVATPQKRNGVFDGALAVSVPLPWIRGTATPPGESPARKLSAIYIFGAAPAPIVVRQLPGGQERILEAAIRARTGQHAASANTVALPAANGAFTIVAVRPSTAVAIGMRAALIVAAPVLAVALAAAAVWVALNAWVIRWTDRMVAAAHAAAVGAPTPAQLDGAPRELRLLGEAFADAAMQADARAQELSTALTHNRALTRELHHRVKNNLQILLSLLGRQQRRATDPAARGALEEARARALPIALAYRFGAQDIDVTNVNLETYLSEVARQIHASYAGVDRAVALMVECEALVTTNEVATALGLIVGESLSGFHTARQGVPGFIHVRLTRTDTPENDSAELTCEIQPPLAAAAEGATGVFDEALVGLLARQIGAAHEVQAGGCIRVHWAVPPTGT